MVKTHSLQSGYSMRRERGFTLVEILISVVVSSLAIATLYASYDIVEKQYSKIRDVTLLHQGGRNILEMIKRDVRMAGFAYRDTSGKIIYGGISEPIKITESGNKCCDDITVTYDYQVQSATTQRLRIKYWVESYRGSKGTRGRLYKQTDILAPNVVTGKKEPMADYVDDLQFTDLSKLASGSGGACDSTKACEIYNGIKTIQGTLSTTQQDMDKRFPPPGSVTTQQYVAIANGTKGSQVTLRNLTRSPAGKPCSHNGFFIPNNWPKGGAKGSPDYYYLTGYYAEVCNDSWSCTTKENYWISKLKPLCMYSDGTSNGRGFTLNSKCNNPSTGQPNKFRIRSDRTSGHLSIESFKNNTWSPELCPAGSLSLIAIEVMLRTKSQFGQSKSFSKKTYYPGNFQLKKTDGFKRKTYSSTVLVRNLVL